MQNILRKNISRKYSRKISDKILAKFSDRFLRKISPRYICTYVFFWGIGVSFLSQAQITLEKIFLEGVYQAPAVNLPMWYPQSNDWFIDEQEKDRLIFYTQDPKSLKTKKTFKPLLFQDLKNEDSLVQEYSKLEISSDGQWLLLYAESKPIYRRSFLSKVWAYHLNSGALIALNKGMPIQHPEIQEKISKVGFVSGNDLYIQDLQAPFEIRQISKTEKDVQSGFANWVYEEEFEVCKAYQWSSDGHYLAYLSFNTQGAPAYSLQKWGQSLYPESYVYAYPKAGEKNAQVDVHVFDIQSQTTQDIPSLQEEYTPRIDFVPGTSTLSIHTLNRKQNHLKIWHVDLIRLNQENDQKRVFYEEKSDTYIEFKPEGQYLQDGSWLGISDKSGYQHLYRISPLGLSTALTEGLEEVSKICEVIEAKQKVYFLQYKSNDPTQKGIYVLDLKTRQKSLWIPKWGSHDISVSQNGGFVLHGFQTLSQAPTYKLHQGDGLWLRNLSSTTSSSPFSSYTANASTPANASSSTLKDPLIDPMKRDGWVLPQWCKVPSADGKDSLNAWFILPPSAIMAKKKCPLLMYTYGGPGSQEAIQEWNGNTHAWMQMMAQKGFVVACVDGRGTGGRGNAFKKCTYLQLGILESDDQIAAAKYLSKRSYHGSYIDTSKISIWGWSFGGYLSLMSATRGKHVFRSAVAVAPVSHWKWYDNIYTERFMQTPLDNPKGYEISSPMHYADSLKTKICVLHGTADDNVHIQHSYGFVQELIQKRKDVTIHVYPDKNHGISGASYRYHVFKTITNFLDSK